MTMEYVQCFLHVLRNVAVIRFTIFSDFPVGSMFPHNQTLDNTLHSVNVTLPKDDVQALSNSKVNVKEVSTL